MDEALSQLLVCPKTGNALRRAGDYLESNGGARYPIINGIPVLLRDDIHQTISLATATLAAARAALREGTGGDPWFIETLGISDPEKNAVRSNEPNKEKDFDPVVSALVGATNGIAYKHLIGSLSCYPIPNLRLPPGNGETLLDIGCSWGRWSIAAARLGYYPIGVDPSLGAVLAAQRACKKLGVKAQFVVGDARYLPFKRESIDVAFSYSVIQHFSRPDAARAISDIGRVLKLNGRYLVQMPTKYGLRCIYHQARRRFREGTEFDVRYWSLGELRNQFESAIGSCEFSVDCYFGIGLQPSDAPLMPWTYRTAIWLSEKLRGLSGVIDPLIYVADSVYARGVKA